MHKVNAVLWKIERYMLPNPQKKGEKGKIKTQKDKKQVLTFCLQHAIISKFASERSSEGQHKKNLKKLEKSA